MSHQNLCGPTDYQRSSQPSSLPFKASPTTHEVDIAAEEVLPETQLAIAGSTCLGHQVDRMIGTLCSVRNREARVCLSGTAARPQAPLLRLRHKTVSRLVL